MMTQMIINDRTYRCHVGRSTHIREAAKRKLAGAALRGKVDAKFFCHLCRSHLSDVPNQACFIFRASHNAQLIVARALFLNHYLQTSIDQVLLCSVLMQSMMRGLANALLTCVLVVGYELFKADSFCMSEPIVCYIYASHDFALHSRACRFRTQALAHSRLVAVYPVPIHTLHVFRKQWRGTPARLRGAHPVSPPAFVPRLIWVGSSGPSL